MFLLEIITSAAVSSVLTGLLLWLTKSWISERIKHSIKNEYDEKLETHKAELKAQSDVEIENLKSRLNTSATEHQVKFLRLHETRATIIANLYSQFVELGKCLNSINHSLEEQKTKGLSPEIIGSEHSRLMDCLTPCWDYFSTNKLYFSLNLSDKIRILLLQCLTFATLTVPTQEQDLSSLPNDLQETLQNLDQATIAERVSKIVSDFNVTIREIENTFRTLVGITE